MSRNGAKGVNNRGDGRDRNLLFGEEAVNLEMTLRFGRVR